MRQAYKLVHQILPPASKRLGLAALALMLLNGLFEVAGVTSVLPLMVVATDPQADQNHAWVRWLQDTFGTTDHQQFLLALALALSLLLGLVNLCGALTLWVSSRFSESLRHHLACQMLDRYLGQPYRWHLTQNSTELCKNTLQEVDHVVIHVVFSLVLVTTNLLSSSLIFFGLIVLEPVVAIGSVVTLTLLYKAVYGLLLPRLDAVGQRRAEADSARFKTVMEALGAVREARAFEARAYFLKTFKGPSSQYSRAEVSRQLVAETPRYATEYLAVLAILSVMVYLALSGHQAVVPLMAVYIMATWRLVPALQSIYRNTVRSQVYLPALKTVHKVLEQPGLSQHQPPPIPLNETIDLVGVELTYPGSGQPAVQGISLQIPRGTTLGLVGQTGAGKSTLADIIAGSLSPTGGQFQIDGQVVEEADLAGWRQNVGYVPQEVYLLDTTVRRNIALGVDDSDIDPVAMEEAAASARIHDFISQQLKAGYETVLGERGVALSGGQRQRIGLARALYHRPDVLVLDEATSALDEATENEVVEALEGLGGKKTIIVVAHRPSTIRHCDRVCRLHNGRLVEDEPEGSQ